MTKSRTIVIKNRFSRDVVFSHVCENNSLKRTVEVEVEVAVKLTANLSGADLSGADLRGAFLSGADLSDADLSDVELSGATGLT
jgi:uncharacterized protein YjbI with pentapeptide repeats